MSNQTEVKKRSGAFIRMLESGAQMKINAEKEGPGSLAKKALVGWKIPLLVWNAPDVKIVWRHLCRSALVLLYPHTNEHVPFETIVRENRISEYHIKNITFNLRLLTWIALLVFFVSLVAIIVFWTINTALTAIGAMAISLAIYWKYSFRLWQVRQRSFDPKVANVSNFMRGEWYLEAFK